jgi:hypothetical protein
MKEKAQRARNQLSWVILNDKSRVERGFTAHLDNQDIARLNQAIEVLNQVIESETVGV